jgi:signal transduction histidine kinase
LSSPEFIKNVILVIVIESESKVEKEEMLISTSSEFEALCRQQMALLTLQLGASLSVVYLTQELVEPPANEAKLVPVIVYPETGVLWQSDSDEAATRRIQYLRNASSLLMGQRLLTPGQDLRDASLDGNTAKQTESQEQGEYLLSGDQIVLPLIYENLMMGLLVTNREDRVWNEQERNQIERIAQTIAIACILEQRKAWLEVQLQEQQIFQEKQQDLLDNLLHQLRNPLTALRTFGKLLVKRLLPGDPNSEVAKSIVRESDRLQELLLQFDKILDLTPADFAAKKLPQKEVVVEASVKTEKDASLLLPGSGEQMTSCTVESVLKPLLISYDAIAQERDLHLTIKIPDNLPAVRANVKALTEVLSNILDNALKYTPSGGKILIEAGKEKPGFQGIAISDTGPGIPLQDLEHLGERYYRGVQAQTEIPGSGLGISIAKQLIEQMQGLLEVISPAISDAIKLPNLPGTTFIVWLTVDC